MFWHSRDRHMRLARSYRAAPALLVLVAAGFMTVRAQQIGIDLSVLPSQIYYISDFDIVGAGGAADLFQLLIENQNTSPIRVTAKLQFGVDGQPQPIIEAQTESFLLTNRRTFTYRDFRGVGTNPDVRVSSFRFNDAIVKQFTEAVLQTGKLPDGVYFITATIEDVDNPGNPIMQQVEFVISTPVTLDPIYPGRPAEQQECGLLFSPLPQFSWESDSDEFQLTVCEWLPTNSDPEDVMQNEPRVRVRLRRGYDFFGSPTFQYPAGALPLEEGKTYYWQVIAFVSRNAFGGGGEEIQLPGPIWCFRLSTAGLSNDQIVLQQLLPLLRILGLTDIEDLFAPGGPLEGFSPTGTVWYNGRQIKLIDLINELQRQPRRVRSAAVE